MEIQTPGLFSAFRKIQIEEDETTPTKEPFSNKMRDKINWVLSELPHNFKSGLCVCLVSLPLSISLSIASGGEPIPGIIGAFWGGIFRDLFGSSSYNIMGPTGGVSGTLALIVADLKKEVLPWIAIYTGIIVFLVRIFRVVDLLMFMPASVISGFTLGVASIMMLSQLDFAIGLVSIKHESKNLIVKTYESFSAVPTITSIYPTLICISTLALLFIWSKKIPKIPAPIVATTYGVLIGFLDKTYGTDPNGSIPTQSSISTLDSKYSNLNIQLVSFPSLTNMYLNSRVLNTSLSCAFVLILESLISAKVADVISKKEHNRQKELVGIGAANFFSGIFGGIPVSAALARTSLNIRSGATSVLSSICSCVCLLVLSYFLMPCVKYLCMSSVAGIVIFVAYRMIDFEQIKHYYKLDTKSLCITILTAILCVTTETTVALLVGIVVALLMLLSNLSTGHAEIQVYNNKTLIGLVDLDKLDNMGKKKNNNNESTCNAPPISTTLQRIFSVNKIKRVLSTKSINNESIKKDITQPLLEHKSEPIHNKKPKSLVIDVSSYKQNIESPEVSPVNGCKNGLGFPHNFVNENLVQYDIVKVPRRSVTRHVCRLPLIVLEEQIVGHTKAMSEADSVEYNDNNKKNQLISDLNNDYLNNSNPKRKKSVYLDVNTCVEEIKFNKTKINSFVTATEHDCINSNNNKVNSLNISGSNMKCTSSCSVNCTDYNNKCVRINTKDKLCNISNQFASLDAYSNDMNGNDKKEIEQNKLNVSDSFKPSSKIYCSKITNTNCLIYRIAGNFTYVHSAAHIKRIKKCIQYGGYQLKYIIIVLRTCAYIDLDGEDALGSIVELLKSENIIASIAGIVSSNVYARLCRHSWFVQIESSGNVFQTWTEALNTYFPNDNTNNDDANLDNKKHIRTVSGISVISDGIHIDARVNEADTF